MSVCHGLRDLLDSTADADQLVEMARTRISIIQAETENLEEILKFWTEAEESRIRIVALETDVEECGGRVVNRSGELAALEQMGMEPNQARISCRRKPGSWRR